LFDLMRELGLRKIFGNVGSTEEQMLQNFPADFEYILSLQECVAVAMADAYSQATGKPVVVNLHTAAGSGNGMGAMETAWYNRTPMIITVVQQVRTMLVHEPYLTNKNPYQQPSTGYGNIDIKACSERGIMVANAPTGNTTTVAEHTVAMGLALLRKLVPANRSVREGRWERLTLQPSELGGKIWGVIGLGGIGRDAALRLQS
jgi:hypothetical protein